MPAPLKLIESHETQPAEADAVVIGAGVIGAFTAYELARRGLKVVLLEKGAVGAEQSSRNWGWCRQQNRDARELPLATKSLGLWERFAQETGKDTGFKRCGLLYLSNDEAEIDRWAKWIDFAHRSGIDTHLLSASQATERGGFSGKSWKGGVFAPTDGIADTSRAAPVVAQAVMDLGGIVLQNCAARGIETSGGRVSSVVTEKGVIRTKTAILAGGAWASSFCRQLDIRFPQSSIRSTVLALSSGGPSIPDALHTADVTITRRGDGSHSVAISGFARVDPSLQKLRFAKEFLPMMLKRTKSLSLGGLEAIRAGHETLSHWKLDRATPMERTRILDPAVDHRIARLAHQRAIDLVPALRNSEISNAWAGFIDSTPDGVPVMGEAPSLPGLVLAAGFSGHGFGLSPGAGHLVADIVTGSEPLVDPLPYHPRRLISSAWGKVAEF